MGTQAKKNALARAKLLAARPLATGKALLCACGHTYSAHWQKVVYDDKSETLGACVYCTDKTMLLGGVPCVTACDHWVPREVSEKQLRKQIDAEEAMSGVLEMTKGVPPNLKRKQE